MNKKGFTLVELLATMVILGILSLVAIPNIVGIVENSKTKTYIEDAKKLYILAEQRFRANTKIKRPTGTSGTACIYMKLSSLDTTELSDPPNSGTYDEDKSYVKITKETDTYKYYVVLAEKLADNNYKGVLDEVESSNLYNESNLNKLIKEKTTVSTTNCDLVN